jgi:hypothetical protein
MNAKLHTLKIKTFLVCFSFLIISSAGKALTYTVGSYVGNGTSQSITGLAFKPDLLFIKSANAYSAVVKTKDMTSGASGPSKIYITSTALCTNCITHLIANGFTVNNNDIVNKSGVTYYFYAFTVGSSLKIGTYSGTGSSTTVNIGANSDFALIFGGSGSGSTAIYEQSGYGGGYSYDERASGSSVQNAYTDPASPSTGASTLWVRNSGPETNASGVTYYYAAFVENGSECAIGAYTGNSTTQSITGVGFKPRFVMSITTYKNGELVFRGGNIAGSNSQYLDGAANAGSLITSLDNDGFSVGTDDDVNMNGAKHHYMAFGGAAGGILPIELLHFDSKRIEARSVEVNWSTASEENNDYFTIERSLDGKEFEAIGKVQGAENSISRINYQFTDENAPENQVAYYRIRQTDKDGMSRAFNIDAVPCLGGKKELELSVAQNPIASNELVYDMNLPESATINVQVIDNLGNIALAQSYYYSRGANRYSIDASELKPGVYILNVTDLTGSAKKSVRFVVNK